jgi:tetratricopeptide (TPR) repeat protein
VNQQSEHLSHAQIEDYGMHTSGAEPDEKEVEKHLEECPSCRRRVLESLLNQLMPRDKKPASPASSGAVSAGFPDPSGEPESAPLSRTSNPANATPSSECPSDDELSDVAAGLCPEAVAGKLIQHTLLCQRCGPLLQSYKENFSDDFSAEERSMLERYASTSQAWQQRIVRKMLQASTASVAPKAFQWAHWSGRKWVLAFSFVLLLAVGTTWLYPLLMLHQARIRVEAEYRKGRPMPYRVTGVPYAPYERERSRRGVVPVVDVPTPERDPLLASNARLLSGDYNEAKLILENALGKERPLPLLNNLVVVYAMEAEDPVNAQNKETRQKDYQEALKTAAEILTRHPSDPAALFNQALVLERLGNHKDAIAALEQLRQVEQDPGWQQEATERLQRIQPTQ